MPSVDEKNSTADESLKISRADLFKRVCIGVRVLPAILTVLMGGYIWLKVVKSNRLDMPSQPYLSISSIHLEENSPIQQAVGRLDESAIAHLIPTFTSDDFKIRSKAVDTLKRILERMGKVSVPSLITTLEHQNEDVRTNAVEILMQVGDRKAVDPLLKMLNQGTMDEPMIVEALLNLKGLPLYYYQDKVQVQIYDSSVGAFEQVSLQFPKVGGKLRGVGVEVEDTQGKFQRKIKAEYDLSYDQSGQGKKLITVIRNKSVDDTKVELTAKLRDEFEEDEVVRLEKGQVVKELDVGEVEYYIDNLVEQKSVALNNIKPELYLQDIEPELYLQDASKFAQGWYHLKRLVQKLLHSPNPLKDGDERNKPNRRSGRAPLSFATFHKRYKCDTQKASAQTPLRLF